MGTVKKVGILYGSLRKESYCRKVAEYVISQAPKETKFEIVDISELSMFNQDLEDNPPKAWVDFREKIKGYDGFLFITPEYNRSVPAVLKNAVDIASRPYGNNLWNLKPAAIISVSPGSLGGFGAYHHLKQTLGFLNLKLMHQPEVYLSNIAEIIEAPGSFEASSAGNYLREFTKAFAKFIEN